MQSSQPPQSAYNHSTSSYSSGNPLQHNANSSTNFGQFTASTDNKNGGFSDLDRILAKYATNTSTNSTTNQGHYSSPNSYNEQYRVGNSGEYMVQNSIISGQSQNNYPTYNYQQQPLNNNTMSECGQFSLDDFMKKYGLGETSSNNVRGTNGINNNTQSSTYNNYTYSSNGYSYNDTANANQSQNKFQYEKSNQNQHSMPSVLHSKPSNEETVKLSLFEDEKPIAQTPLLNNSPQNSYGSNNYTSSYNYQPITSHRPIATTENKSLIGESFISKDDVTMRKSRVEPEYNLKYFHKYSTISSSRVKPHNYERTVDSRVHQNHSQQSYGFGQGYKEHYQKIGQHNNQGNGGFRNVQNYPQQQPSTGNYQQYKKLETTLATNPVNKEGFIPLHKTKEQILADKNQLNDFEEQDRVVYDMLEVQKKALANLREKDFERGSKTNCNLLKGNQVMYDINTTDDRQKEGLMSKWCS